MFSHSHCLNSQVWAHTEAEARALSGRRGARAFEPACCLESGGHSERGVLRDASCVCVRTGRGGFEDLTFRNVLDVYVLSSKLLVFYSLLQSCWDFLLTLHAHCAHTVACAFMQVEEKYMFQRILQQQYVRMCVRTSTNRQCIFMYSYMHRVIQAHLASLASAVT